MLLVGDAVHAGHLVAILAAILLFAAVLRLLRSCGVPLLLSVAFTALAFVGRTSTLALREMRGDILATALSMCAISMLLSRRRGDPRWELGVAGWLTLAFATKITAIAALLPAAAFLWWNGGRRAAARLIVFTMVGCTLIVAATQVASGGRFLRVLSECVSGGASWRDMVGGPLAFLRSMLFHDEATLLWLGCAVLAIVGVAARAPELLLTPGPIALVATAWGTTLASTIVIFGSPGTDFNHLIDLSVLSVVLVVVVAAQVQPLRALRIVVVTGGVLVVLLSWLHPQRDEGGAVRSFLRTSVPAADVASGPVVAENPMVPVMLGEAPYVLDQFMLQLVYRRRPSFVDPLVDGLRRQAFRAVVLNHPPAPDGTEAYAVNHFGPRFVDALHEYYRPTATHGVYRVFTRRVAPAREPVASPR
jgi:hypothetical protein